MNRRQFSAAIAAFANLPLGQPALGAAPPARRTQVSIRGDAFLINGRPTYEGRTFEGRKVEGLLMNTRAVQGIFDDMNPETRDSWAYPDTGRWDPDRNTTEYLAGMEEWRRAGVLGFTINLQGGMARRRGPADVGADGAPIQNAANLALDNSAFAPDGALRPAFMARLERILDHADRLGMVPIVGYFYFGQDQRLQDEAAVKRAVVNATEWLLIRQYSNVLVEVNNECNLSYDHEILKPARVTELIELIKGMSRDGRRLLVSTSFGGPTSSGARDHPDTPITANVVGASDFVIVHGNGPADPALLTKMVEATRSFPSYRPMPVIVNEDNNFQFDRPDARILVALRQYVSWGYYEQGDNNYRDGLQSPPVNWRAVTENKRNFLDKVRQIAGA